MSSSHRPYDFGANWRSFVRSHLTLESRLEAMKAMRSFLGVESLAGKTFVDIGCGSGLHSWAAYKLGASQVISFDADPESVACCQQLRLEEGSPANWEVATVSILDEAAVANLGQFDIVYCWGVLHHTGRMWRALEHTAQMVAPGGVMWLAIYNRMEGIGLHSDGRVGSSRFWEREKALYNALPKVGQRCLDYLAAGGMIAGYLVAGKNPIREIKTHRSNRGMAWLVDVRDWLGGWPYEYAAVDEVFGFVQQRFGYQLENLISTNSLQNNEFLFRRPVASRDRDKRLHPEPLGVTQGCHALPE
jgi:2-polyprenyl-6-hydroxyphenyl methylase/3-demethylubiquinone-9 3-methyltransferase